MAHELDLYPAGQASGNGYHPWQRVGVDDLAERQTMRDRGAHERVSGTQSRGFHPGNGYHHRRAGLHSPELGRDLVVMPAVGGRDTSTRDGAHRQEDGDMSDGMHFRFKSLTKEQQ